MNVLMDGTLVGTYSPTTTTSFTTYTTSPFHLAAGYHSIEFTSVGTAVDSSVFIDLVSIASTVNNLTNASFETPPVGTSNYQYNPTGGTWTFTGASGIQSNGSAWGAPAAPDGTQTAFLQSYPGSTNGSMSQTFNFSTAGTYALSFQAALRPGGTGAISVNVLMDGTVVGTCSPTTTTSFTSYTTSTFQVTAGSHTIQFASVGAVDSSVFIDLVNIASTVNNPSNSSFETPSVGTKSYSYNPTGGSWTFTGQSGIQSNGSIWGAPAAPDGTQTAFVQSNTGTTNGSISQAVNFSTAGTYAVSFQAAARSTNNGPISMNVLVDGTVVGTYSPTTTTSFTSYTTSLFQVAAGNHTIQFAAVGAPVNSSIFIDLVTMP